MLPKLWRTSRLQRNKEKKREKKNSLKIHAFSHGEVMLQPVSKFELPAAPEGSSVMLSLIHI